MSMFVFFAIWMTFLAASLFGYVATFHLAEKLWNSSWRRIFYWIISLVVWLLFFWMKDGDPIGFFDWLAA